jgi:VWFA-related protein
MVVLAIPALVLAAAVVPSRPVFRSEVGLVVLQATVKNSRGEVVKDLDRGAFTVYENGKPQTLSVFHRDDVPVSLGILIDNSGSMKRKRAQVEAAALALVRASNPEDEVFVLDFGDKPRVDVPFTKDLAVLEAGIRRVDSVGGTAMRDAIEMGESYLASQAVHDRKVLLVITDGNDNASVAPMGRIRQIAERSGTVIDAIGLLTEEDPPKARRAREDLDELTEATGGIAYFPRSVEQVGAIALELAAQIRSQYTLGYSPVNQALDGSYRKLRVVAKGPERLVVRTRAGYRAVAAPAPTAPAARR